MWDVEHILSLLTVPIFKKDARSDCTNHCRISFVPIATKFFLVPVKLRSVLPIRVANVHEQRAGFRPGRG